MGFHSLKKYMFSKYKMVFIDFIIKEDKFWNDCNGIVFERFQKNDINMLNEILLQRDFRSDFNIDDAIDRLQSNFLLYVIKNKDKIVGYDWYALKIFYIKFLEARIELKEDEVYGIFSFIHRDFRGMGLLNGLHSYANYDLRKLGYKRVIGNYSPSNRAAHRAFSKFGYEIIGEITHGYIATIRYMLNNIRKDKIKINHSPFVFYKKLFKKLF